jgi:hypothetical protein
MESSCPSKKVALDSFLSTMNELSLSDPSISTKLQEISESIENGMNVVKQGGKKKYHKRKSYRGGMMPAVIAPAAVGAITPAERSSLLNALAHIIAVGTITGGTSASMCYITPAIEAYLAIRGWLPMLCSGTGVVGMFEWGLRLVAAPITNIETCMAIQARYDIIVTRIILASSIPSGFALLHERAKFKGKYLEYQEAIYNILNFCVEKIKTIFRSSAREPQFTEEQIKQIVDEAVYTEFPDLRETAMADPSLAVAGPSVADPSLAVAGPSAASPSSFSSSGMFSRFFGGTRRHRKRKNTKHKTTKRRKSRKTIKHRTRR